MLDIHTASQWYPPNDPVHGFNHVLRVLKLAEAIGSQEGADLQILRAAVLLHDAHGETPSEDVESPGRNTHHHASAGFARRVLEGEGWDEARIAAVTHCIRSHRFRDNSEPPNTIEAMTLFDADKLDAIGAIGAARAVAYAAHAGQPAFARPSERFYQTGEREPVEAYSAYHEYIFKLRKIKDRMFTDTGKRMAEERHRFMDEFFERLKQESETGS